MVLASFIVTLAVALLAALGLRKSSRRSILICSGFTLFIIALLAALKMRDIGAEAGNGAEYLKIESTYARFNNLVAQGKYAESLELIEPNYRNLLKADPEFMEAFKLGFGRLGQPETALYPSRKIRIDNSAALLEIRNISEVGFTYEVEFVKVDGEWYLGKNLQVVTGG